ncbi:MAG: DUF5666 domain-containing protein [Chloroflexi bacterium]|nr:DUF5666 domain-containing protein [Chloroflexota bacterium]
MNQAVKIVIGVVVVLAVAGGSFYGGMVYGKSQVPTFPNAALRGQGGAGGFVPGGQAAAGQAQAGATGRQGAQGGFVIGQIEELGNGVLTITDTNGKQTRVTVTDTTLIEKNASVTLADLTKGETVMVSGATGTDGTITARSVQVSPAGRFVGGGQPGAGGTQ